MSEMLTWPTSSSECFLEQLQKVVLNGAVNYKIVKKQPIISQSLSFFPMSTGKQIWGSAPSRRWLYDYRDKLFSGRHVSKLCATPLALMFVRSGLLDVLMRPNPGMGKEAMSLL